LLESPTFFALLLQIDEDLAEAAREAGCPACGGTLHQADYPRKPRGCPVPWRAAFATRRSFCCARCRRRLTPRSVRFLGRRVYLGLIVVVACVRHTGHHPKTAALAATLAIPIRTLRRWQTWWREQLAQTPLWCGAQGRFVPPVDLQQAPGSLLERFGGAAADALAALLRFLSPLTSRSDRLHEGGRGYAEDAARRRPGTPLG
jgi:hypothetical protein